MDWILWYICWSIMSVGKCSIKSNNTIWNSFDLMNFLLIMRIRTACNSNKVSNLPTCYFRCIYKDLFLRNFSSCLKSSKSIWNHFTIKLNESCINNSSVSSLNQQISCWHLRTWNSLKLNHCKILLRLSLFPNQ